jgi:predicted ATPase
LAEERMIGRVRIRNYKSISDLQLELGKLTILIGPNSSGKSSILDGLGLFFRMAKLEAGLTFDWYLRNEVTHYNEIVHRRQVQLPMMFDIQVSLKDEEYNTLLEMAQSLPRDNKVGLGQDKLKPQLGYSFEFKQTYLMRQTLYSNGDLFGVRNEYTNISDSGHRMYFHLVPEGFENYRDKFSAQNILCRDLAQAKRTLSDDPIIQFVAKAQEIMEQELAKGYFLSEIREPMEWEVPLSGVHPENVGPRGENTLNVLTYIANSREYKTINSKISKWVSEFGYSDMASYVKSVKQEPHATSDAQDEVLDVPINIAAAGFGFQQILPIITQCFYLERGGTLIVEEPEIHLHPANQMRMVDLFIDAVDFGNQVVIATHSEHMFLRLQRRVAEGTISPGDVAIYYVEKTVNGTKVERVGLREDGSIPGWLPSFVDTVRDEGALVVEEKMKRRVEE